MTAFNGNLKSGVFLSLAASVACAGLAPTAEARPALDGVNMITCNAPIISDIGTWWKLDCRQRGVVYGVAKGGYGGNYGCDQVIAYSMTNGVGGELDIYAGYIQRDSTTYSIYPNPSAAWGNQAGTACNTSSWNAHMAQIAASPTPAPTATTTDPVGDVPVTPGVQPSPSPSPSYSYSLNQSPDLAIDNRVDYVE